MPNTIFSLLDTPAYGGAESYLLDVLTHLQRSGYRVVLATNNEQVRSLAPAGITVIKLPYRLDAIGNWKGLVKYFLALPASIYWLISTLQQLQQNASVVCLFPGYTDRLSFSPFIKWFGYSLIWLEYGPLEPTFDRNHGFPRLLYAIGRPYPDRVVTISEWTKRSLVKLGKIPAEKIEIIYPGVETGLRPVSSKVKGRMTVVTVARLAKEKEIDLLIKAWSMLQPTKAHLQIIGDGPDRDTLEEHVVTLGLEDQISFLGFVTDTKKAELFQHADLFVFPSAWDLEGFGMTTIEAMAAGLPVISTGYGPQAEIVSDGTTGWTFTPHDAKDLARVIGRALADPERAKIATQGQRSISESFSRQHSHDAWIAVVQSVQK